MSRDKLRLPEYLQHILDAIARISRYTAGMDKQAFESDELVRDAVIRNIEIVGEASYNIRKHHPDFVGAHANLPWGGAYGMRNALAHGYYAVDLDVVWNTLLNDLPTLARDVQELLDELVRRG
ncbi:DUF86 domain-containing protein [Paraburkholderia silviterrae]|uniref:DUF86 domain-containing protein n=1 Tax=Paraburkholderia silviterrae TaxID=2528715 RepID=A0A4R5MGU4_9BURK|nr:DUF86 domain-containing protein [Paraburkholderia silviterrae]TDG26492.1 DUF86 domain-containing protein [Paraburkholderia silviterrae]